MREPFWLLRLANRQSVCPSTAVRLQAVPAVPCRSGALKAPAVLTAWDGDPDIPKVASETAPGSTRLKSIEVDHCNRDDLMSGI